MQQGIKDLAVFSVVIVHVLVQCALLNHGASIGTLHHLASVTTFTAAMPFLISLYLAIVYKQTSPSLSLYPQTFSQSVCPEVYLSLLTYFTSHSVDRTIEGFVLRTLLV